MERVPASMRTGNSVAAPMLTSTLPEQFGNWLSSLSWSRERRRSTRERHQWTEMDRGKRKDRKSGTERWEEEESEIQGEGRRLA